MRLLGFEVAIMRLKQGAFVRRDCIKNDTVILVHKDRLYQMSKAQGVRYPYVPTNADLMAHDWEIVETNNDTEE